MLTRDHKIRARFESGYKNSDQSALKILVSLFQSLTLFQDFRGLLFCSRCNRRAQSGRRPIGRTFREFPGLFNFFDITVMCSQEICDTVINSLPTEVL